MCETFTPPCTHFVSIVIPYHNNREGISRLLSSIPSSDQIEVIVVNDNSPSISDIIESSALPHLKYITQNEEERWAGAARNKGLRVATGRFVLFADSDDYFLPDFLLTIRQYFESDFDVVYFKPISRFEDGNIAPRANKYIELVERYLNGDDSIRFEYFVPWSKLVRRHFIITNNIAFDEVIASNDVMFSLRCGAEAKSYHVSEKEIYCVTESKNSLTKTKSREVIESRFSVYCRYNDYLKENCHDRKLLSAISCLSRSRELGVAHFFRTLKQVVKRGYPILPDIYGLKRWIKSN